MKMSLFAITGLLLFSTPVTAEQSAQNELIYDGTVIVELAAELDLELDEIIELLESPMQPILIRLHETSRLAEKQKIGTVALTTYVSYVHAIDILIAVQAQEQLLNQSIWLIDPTERTLVEQQSYNLWLSIATKYGYFRLWSNVVRAREECAPYDCALLQAELAALEDQLDGQFKQANDLHHEWVQIHQ